MIVTQVVFSMFVVGSRDHILAQHFGAFLALVPIFSILVHNSYIPNINDPFPRQENNGRGFLLQILEGPRSSRDAE